MEGVFFGSGGDGKGVGVASRGVGGVYKRQADIKPHSEKWVRPTKKKALTYRILSRCLTGGLLYTPDAAGEKRRSVSYPPLTPPPTHYAMLPLVAISCRQLAHTLP